VGVTAPSESTHPAEWASKRPQERQRDSCKQLYLLTEPSGWLHITTGVLRLRGAEFFG
jgi:hypothetical protein